MPDISRFESGHLEIDGEGRSLVPKELWKRTGMKTGRSPGFNEEPAGVQLHTPSRLAKLYIEPTDKCNIGCRTCIRQTWSEPTGNMSEAVFSRLLEELRVFPLPLKVVFGGFGEPLFHPSIVDMVGRVKALGATVELITNATLLTVEMTKGLVSSGLDILWASLDGATPESYADIRLGAAFPRVVENLGAFRDYLNYHITEPYFAVIPDYKTELGIVFVAMKRNIAELPRVIDLGHQLCARQFLVTNVLPYSPEMASETLYSAALDDHRISSLSLPKMDLTEQTRSAVLEAIKRVDGVWPGNAPGLASGKCPFIESGAGAVAWNGDFSPCLALLHSHVTYPSRFGHLKRVVHSWKLGNVAETNLKELWNRPEHLAFREKVQASGFSPCMLCGGCELAEANEADCIGNAFPTCGACLWSQGVVQCP